MAVQSTLRHSAAEAALAAFVDKYSELIRTRLRNTSRTTRLLSTLALAASIILAGEGTRRWWKSRREEREQGRKLVRTNSWLHNKDGSRTIYVPYKDSTSKVVIYETKPLTFEAHRRLFLNPPRVSGLGDGPVPAAQTKPGLNLAFLHQFLSLMSIMIPRWSSKEAGLLVSHAGFLMLRTYLSLVVARLDGEIVRDLVAGNGKSFLLGLLKWCGLGGFASYTNAMIKFLESKVSIAFRTRLTRYIHDLYLNDNLNYYKLANLDGGVGQGADQYITQDLTLFCAAAANLYSSLGKPFVDICVFNYQLYRSLGPLALTGLLSNYFLTASILRRVSPPFGKLKAVEGRKEGDFRSLHARLIANAEEVAFYGGAEMEKTFLNKEFKSLKNWMEGIYMLKIRYNILEDFILKYSWSAYGYLLSSLPVFLPAWGGLGGASEQAGHSEKHGRERTRMKDFITNKRLMLSLADAGGRMMYSIKDLSELAGYTSRVYTLISTLHRAHADAYYVRGRENELYSLSDVQGTIQKGFDGVRLENVPIVAPALWPQGGDELIESLSMIIRRGDHLLVSPPTSCAALQANPSHPDLRTQRRRQERHRARHRRPLARLPRPGQSAQEQRRGRHHVSAAAAVPQHRHAARPGHLPRRRVRHARQAQDGARPQARARPGPARLPPRARGRLGHAQGVEGRAQRRREAAARHRAAAVPRAAVCVYRRGHQRRVE